MWHITPCRKTDAWPGRAFSQSCATGVPGLPYLCAILSLPRSNYRLQLGGPREDVLCVAVAADARTGPLGAASARPLRYGCGGSRRTTRIACAKVEVAVHAPLIFRRYYDDGTSHPGKNCLAMPISMGILCEKCGIVYLMAATAHHFIDNLPRAGSDMFTLTCTGCGTKRSFQQNDLMPCSVSPHGHARAYAERGEYSVRQHLVNIPFRKPGN